MNCSTFNLSVTLLMMVLLYGENSSIVKVLVFVVYTWSYKVLLTLKENNDHPDIWPRCLNLFKTAMDDVDLYIYTYSTIWRHESGLRKGRRIYGRTRYRWPIREKWQVLKRIYSSTDTSGRTGVVGEARVPPEWRDYWRRSVWTTTTFPQYWGTDTQTDPRRTAVPDPE